MPNSIQHSGQVTCPECNQTYPVRVWLVIDESEHPEQLEDVRSSRLHTVNCPGCGKMIQLDLPVLFYRPGKQPVLVLSPSNLATEAEFQQHGQAMLGMLRNNLGEAWQHVWVENMEIVPKSDLAAVLFGEADVTEPGQGADMAAEDERPELDNQEVFEIIQKVGPIVERFLQAETWSDSMRIVEANPELLNTDAILLLAHLAETASKEGDELREAFFTDHMMLLDRCREIGIKGAFEEFAKENAEQATNRFQEDLSNALSLYQKFKQTNDPRLLEASVNSWKRALPHPLLREMGSDMVSTLFSQAGAAFLDLYQVRGASIDLEQGTILLRRALSLHAPDSGGKADLLANLGAALTFLYELTGEVKDLQDALEMCQEASALLAIEAPDSVNILMNLAGSFRVLYNRSGNMDHLNEAIRELQIVVDKDSDNTSVAALACSNLGACLRARGSARHNLADLQSAAKFQQRALDITPENSPNRASFLNNLGNTLRELYAEASNPDDLEKSILLFEQIIAVTPEESSRFPSRINNLGLSLLDRYHLKHDRQDLEKAIQSLQKAVDRSPSGYVDLPRFRHQLADGLSDRYKLTADDGDANAAIGLYHQAIQQLPTESQYQGSYYYRLGNILQTRYGKLHTLDDLEGAIQAYHKAVEHTRPDTSDFTPFSVSLAEAMMLRYEHSHDPEDINKVIQTYQQAVERLDPASTSAPRLYNELGEALLVRSEQKQEGNDFEAAFQTFERAAYTATVGTRDWCRAKSNWMDSQRKYFEKSRDLDKFDWAIQTYRHDVAQIADETDEKHLLLGQLALALRVRYDRKHRLEDLNEAIQLIRTITQNLPAGRLEMSAIYGVLGSCYQLRYPESHAQTDLDEAVIAFQEAIRHPDKVELEISNHIFLALLFNQRYHSIGNASDQSASLENLQMAVEIYSEHAPSLKPGKVFSSGINTLIGQYNRTGHIQELEQFIQLFQQLVQLLDEYPEALPELLITLASILQILHSHSFQPGPIEEAIEYMERAISIGETGGQATAQAYHRYGVCLRASYHLNGDQRDIQTAAEVLHQAVILAVPGDPDLPAYLTDEGTAISDRYKISSDINDLEAAISSYQKAVDMLPLSASDSVLCWNNLATGLLERYKQLGSLADLEQAILLMQRVLASDEADPKDQAGANSNLGVALADRFESAGNMADLEHGLQAHRRAVAICNPASPDYAMYLNNLGSILRVRHRLNRELKDLEEAILIQYKSVELTSPGSPTYLTHLNNLANALLERHQIYNEESDLEESIRIYRKVVELSSGSNHLLAISNTNLGNALFRRYQLNQDPIALEEVEKSYRLAQSLTDEGSLIMDRLLGNIGNVLHEYYQISGDQKYLSEYRQVMTDASCKGMLTDPVNILPMIKQWARYETARQAWEVAGKAYAYSLQTINQLFRTQLLRKHKETWLSEAQGIPARAAFARAKMGDCNEAVLILENERTHLQSEALLQHGADLETLRATRPDLVDRYSSISARLSSYQSTELDKVNTTLDLLAMQSANRELEALIEEIRHIDGYTNFLQRFTLAQIHETAGPAPLVYLVVTPEGGMAFIVDSIRVTLLPLDQMTESALRGKLADFVQEQINWLSALTNKNTDQHQKAEATSAWFSQLDEITGWLWNAGIGLLCEHLNAAGITRGVLIPTGLLGLLPLHSAWCEDPDAPTGRHYALDSIAFSYAPNAQSLQRAQGTARRVAPTALLAVDNPDGSLRSSENEVQVAAAGFEQARVLAGVEATRQAVIEALPGYPVLHFSTHGHANWEDPLRGGLLLAGGEFTLADLLGLHLQNARMAVLSACQTGVQDVTLPDEAISLAGGCLQAGIAGVVASLWTVDDVSTAMLMARFYDLWKKDGLQPAEALLGAQIWLRDTTNGEKKRYFKTALPEFTNQRLPSSAADAFFKSVVLKDDNQRAFVHPYYWAAFTLTGV